MLQEPQKPGFGWKKAMVLGLVALAAVLIYFEQPAPGAERPRPMSETWAPLFGNGATTGGISFSSTISLINLSTTTSQASITSFGSSGSPIPLLQDPNGGTSVDSVFVTIPPSGTMQIDSLNPDPNVLESGYLGIFTSNQQVVTQTEFSIFQNNQLQARAQIPATPLFQAGSFPIGQEGSTGVAIMNPIFNPDAADVQIGVANQDGKIFDTTSVTLDPGVQISRFLDQLSVDPLGATSAEFRSTLPIAILPLNQDGLVLTTQSVFPPRNLQSLFRED